MTTDTKEWLSRTQAARHAGVSLSTVDRWLNSGELTRYYQGPSNRVRISTGELDLLTAVRPEPVDSPQSA